MSRFLHSPAVDSMALVFWQTIAGVYFLGLTGVGVFVLKETLHVREVVRELEVRDHQIDEARALIERTGAIDVAEVERGSSDDR